MSDPVTVAGFLEKKGPHRLSAWKVRFFSLADNVLVYAKDEETIDTPSGTIVLSDSYTIRTVKSRLDSFYYFDIVTPGRTYHLRANKDASRGAWVDALNVAKSRSIHELSPLARDIQTLDGDALREVCMALVAGIEVKPRTYHLKAYDDCFVASDAVDWVVAHYGSQSPDAVAAAAASRPPAPLCSDVMTRAYAVTLLQRLVEAGFISHVADEDKAFHDGYLFFKVADLLASSYAMATDQNGDFGGSSTAGASSVDSIALTPGTIAPPTASKSMVTIAKLESTIRELREELAAARNSAARVSEDHEAEVNSLHDRIADLNAQLTHRPTWIEDDQRPACHACQIPFSFFRRRHHCRVCGEIFCSECCKLKVPIMDGAPIRILVCDADSLVLS